MTMSSSAIPDYRTTEHWPERCTLGWLIAKLRIFEGLQMRRNHQQMKKVPSILSEEGQSNINDVREQAIIAAAICNAPGRDRIILLCDELNPSEGLTAANVVTLRAGYAGRSLARWKKRICSCWAKPPMCWMPKRPRWKATPPKTGDDGIAWTPAKGPAQWGKIFDMSSATFKRRCNEGKIRCKKLSPKSYQVAIDDLPAKHQAKFRSSTK